MKCKNAPLAAKRVFTQLEPYLSDAEINRIIAALTSDERMESLWVAIQNWNDGQTEYFVRDAILFALPHVLTDLTLPPERRVLSTSGNYSLWITAERFAETIEANQVEATRFWPEIVKDILPKVRAFSKHQYERGYALWSSMEDISAPDRRGRGTPREIAYGSAMTRTLEKIGALSREKQDEVIAILTQVIFGYPITKRVDPERIKARRKRKRRKSGAA
jgi:hypothetical protein